MWVCRRVWRAGIPCGAQFGWKTPPWTDFVTPTQRPMMSPIRRSKIAALIKFLCVLVKPAQHPQNALLRFLSFIILFCSRRLGHAFDVLWHLLLIATSPVLLHPVSVFCFAKASISVSNPELEPVIFCFDSDFCMNEYGELSPSIVDFSW